MSGTVATKLVGCSDCSEAKRPQNWQVGFIMTAPDSWFAVCTVCDNIVPLGGALAMRLLTNAQENTPEDPPKGVLN